MSKHPLLFAFTILALSHVACDGPEPAGDVADDAIQQVYEGKLTVSQAEAGCRCRLEVVPIGGTVFHFGLDLSQTPPVPYPFQSTVAGARVSIAEVPITRLLNIRSGSDGKWGFKAVKLKGTPLRVSFVYELAGYQTTKSQVFEIGGDGITDLAVQFPSAAYFAAAKGAIEQQISALIGAPYALNNVLVTTVGKSWASMYNPVTPHGDPGVPDLGGAALLQRRRRRGRDADHHLGRRRRVLRQPGGRQPPGHGQQGAVLLRPAHLRRPGSYRAVRGVTAACDPGDERFPRRPAVAPALRRARHNVVPRPTQRAGITWSARNTRAVCPRPAKRGEGKGG
jgi:hypothetical protein